MESVNIMPELLTDQETKEITTRINKLNGILLGTAVIKANLVTDQEYNQIMSRIDDMWKNIGIGFDATEEILYWQERFKELSRQTSSCFNFLCVLCFKFLLQGRHDKKWIQVGLNPGTLCCKPALLPLHRRDCWPIP